MSDGQKSESRQAPGGSVICSHCEHNFSSVVNFNWEMDDKLDFQLKLFKKTDDGSPPFVSQGFTYQQQDNVGQRCTVKCPDCEKMFELSIHLSRTVNENKLKIKLSITTCVVGKEKMGKQNKGETDTTEKPGFLALRRVKVFYKCSGETFRGDDQVKEQLMMDRRRTLHVQEANLKDSDIVIVFCPITSRVGSDVESCMRDETVLSSNKPVILVLMHHTRDFDYSTAGIIWSEVYPNVVLDVHVLFHETKPGLLRCRQNQEAFEMIKKELRKHSKPVIGMLTHYQTR